jgi:hypothetical protein
MPFIPPMLATRLEDPRRLADLRYSAEPKLDGQPAQLHVRDHRTNHAFSRPGRELIRLPGLAWLRDIRWSVASDPQPSDIVTRRAPDDADVRPQRTSGMLWANLNTSVGSYFCLTPIRNGTKLCVGLLQYAWT